MIDKRELDDVLNKFRDMDIGDQNSYHRTIYTEPREELDFFEEISKVMSDNNVTQYEFTYCGGFDSPGYDIDCYCISYIDLKGRLQTIPVHFEIY